MDGVGKVERRVLLGAVVHFFSLFNPLLESPSWLAAGRLRRRSGVRRARRWGYARCLSVIKRIT